MSIIWLIADLMVASIVLMLVFGFGWSMGYRRAIRAYQERLTHPLVGMDANGNLVRVGDTIEKVRGRVTKPRLIDYYDIETRNQGKVLCPSDLTTVDDRAVVLIRRGYYDEDLRETWNLKDCIRKDN